MRIGLVLACLAALLCAAALWFALSGDQAPVVSRTEQSTTPAEPPRSALEISETAAQRALDVAEPLDPARASATDANEPADAIWIEGRVIFPPGTPADEHAEIVAEFEHEKSVKPHRAAVAADGAFRAAFPAESTSARLELSARYLFLFEPYHLDVQTQHGPVVLEPELGGLVHVVFVPPAGALERAKELVGTEFRVAPATPLRNANARRFESRELSIETATHIDIGGLIPGVSYQLMAEPETLAPFQVHGVRVEPGSTTDVTVQLEKGVRLSGRVVDENTRPIAGATFDVTVHNGNESTHMDRKALSSSDGSFALLGIRPGKMKLDVAAAGYLRTRVRLESASDANEITDITAVLKHGAALRGRVQWADKSPASGAEITIDLMSNAPGQQWDELGWSDVQKATAAADGTFEFPGLTAGPFIVSARMTTESRRGSARLESAPSGGEPIVMTLDEGHELKGHVVDDLGHAVPRFTARAIPSNSDENSTFGGDDSVAARILGDEGSFVFDALRAGSWSIAVRGPAGSVRRDWVVPGDGDTIEFLLPRPASIAGIVVDPSGQPVRGARVSYLPKTKAYFDDSDRIAAPPTGTDGRFTLAAVSSGSGLLTATHFRFATSESPSLDLAPGQTQKDVVLTLRTSGRLTGDVHDAEGRPDPMRWLSLMPRSGTTQISAYFQCEPDATFELDGLPAGKYSLATGSSPAEREAAAEAGDPGMKNGPPPVRLEVTITAGETTHVVIGERPRTQIKVVGRVSARDRALAGATVSAYDSSGAVRGTTGSDGQYELTVTKPGEYWFTVVAAGSGTNVQRNATIPEGPQTTLDFELTGGRIAGRVVTPAGEPAGNMQVELRVQSQKYDATPGATHTTFGHQTTGADGRFAFDLLSSGTYRLRAIESLYFGTDQVARYGPVTARDLAIADDTALDDLVLKLEAAARLDVDVVGPKGEPSGGAEVFAFDESGEAVQDFSGKLTDTAGHMRVGGLPPRAVFVFARKNTLASAVFGPVRAKESDVPSVKLELLPATTLEVAVELAPGVATARTSVRDEHGIDFTRLWARSGFGAIGTPNGMRVGPLPPGRYRVELEDKELAKHGVDVVVAGEETREVKLKVPAPKSSD